MPRRPETQRARAANTLRFTPVSFITADVLARLSAPARLYYCHFYSTLHNILLSSQERKSSERSLVEKCHGKSKETESGLFHANFKVSCGIREKATMAGSALGPENISSRELVLLVSLPWKLCLLEDVSRLSPQLSSFFS
ncbi:hypothetical protein QTP70_025849 [Hemibagrus guttatus]|uniref:Uncharacterized protein n=1 Tax=Hemibagrus guttatus TaxID=175788 RepID=A0AAE0PSN4_9TELE|nr:hypothetical protein QTP70_025849 [Hemibagrus guttatus]KAK3523219.1 hypothetical protein QTP86_022943 [Hemibagrus guttatus]